MMVTMAQLEAAERKGFELFGDIFKETLAYVQIQRKKKELREDENLRGSLGKVKK